LIFTNIVEIPSPAAGLHALDASLPDFWRKHRSEPMPPKPDSLVADVNAPLVQQVLHIPE